jgi:hypothetical protein
LGHKRSLSGAGTWVGADARASSNCCAAGKHQALPVPGGESQAGAAVVEQRLPAHRRRTDGGEQRSGGVHAA